MTVRALDGRGSAHFESVLLAFWNADCSASRKGRLATHWAAVPPKFQEIRVDCLGVVNTKGVTTFRVQGVAPLSLMPAMNEHEERAFMRILEVELARKTGWNITGVNRDMIDWKGEDRPS